MKIDDSVLLECIQHLCGYDFGDVMDYKTYDGFIIATMSSDPTKDYFYGTKSVDITFDEYQEFVRRKKLNAIKKSIH